MGPPSGVKKSKKRNLVFSTPNNVGLSNTPTSRNFDNSNSNTNRNILNLENDENQFLKNNNANNEHSPHPENTRRSF